MLSMYLTHTGYWVWASPVSSSSSLLSPSSVSLSPPLFQSQNLLSEIITAHILFIKRSSHLFSRSLLKLITSNACVCGHILGHKYGQYFPLP